MAARLQISAATGQPAGRLRRLLADETDRFSDPWAVDPIILAPRRWAIRARSFTMRLREKGKKGGPVVTMGWDEAQAAIQAGTHEPDNTDSSDAEGPNEAKVSGEPDDDLDAKTKAELEALAKERGVEISAAKTKADIVEALRKA